MGLLFSIVVRECYIEWLSPIIEESKVLAIITKK